MKSWVSNSRFLALMVIISLPEAGKAAPLTKSHNLMLKVERVEKERVTFSSFTPTLDISLRESEFLKYYEVIIWEETSSVHFYEFPNDFNSWYGYDITSVDEDGFPLGLRRNDVTDDQKISYREQFLVEKFTDMPKPWTDASSDFLKSAFMDIASFLVNRHPASEHHLKYNGHGGPGGRLFAGLMQADHAYEFLEFWSQSLGRPLGVIDMGGPCNKGSFADLDNFCDSARYYIASDLLNGGYSMDEFTWAKREEVWPLAQYHNLFSTNKTLDEVLKGRIDLKRKAYEYSRNNMITNRVAQANYLYSCAAFRAFSPGFGAFLGKAGVNFHILDDLYQYMIENNAPDTLVEQFNYVILHKADNKDFFAWRDARHGMLMPHFSFLLDLLQSQPHNVTGISGIEQQGPAGEALGQPFVVLVQNPNGDPLAGATVTFMVTSGGGTLSVTTATTDANGRASTTLTLGPDPGPNTVTATVAGLDPATFPAVGFAIPRTVGKLSGDDQDGPAGASLVEPFVVQVKDQNGNPLEGAEVAFAVTAGGGTLSATTATTDARGRASTTLTLGPDPGSNTVTATATGLDPVAFSAVGSAIPHSLKKLSGQDQQKAAGAALTEPFVVEVRDQKGQPLEGAEVSFAVTAGAGTLSATTATTGADGRASAILTLGRDPGRNTVVARVAELKPVIFGATGLAIPTTLAGISGGDQQGAAGVALSEPFVVEVRDQNDNPLQGAEITFAVTAGGGTLSAATATTDANGRAAATLTLGRDPETVTVTATVARLDPVTFTATAKATADFDGDGETGFSDFFLFADAFGGSDPRFDLDGSGTVDFGDFFLLADHFGDPARGKLLALARELIGLPDGPQLQQNAPNPFNSETVISWFLLRPGPARLEVYALTGQRVGVLQEGPLKAGRHRVHWDGRDHQSRSLASGVYLYRLVTDENVQTRKLTLLR